MPLWKPDWMKWLFLKFLSQSLLPCLLGESVCWHGFLNPAVGGKDMASIAALILLKILRYSILHYFADIPAHSLVKFSWSWHLHYFRITLLYYYYYYYYFYFYFYFFLQKNNTEDKDKIKQRARRQTAFSHSASSPSFNQQLQADEWGLALPRWHLIYWSDVIQWWRTLLILFRSSHTWTTTGTCKCQ